jgi:hypothetical protein
MLALYLIGVLTGIIIGMLIMGLIFSIKFKKSKPFCLKLNNFDYNPEHKTPKTKLELSSKEEMK